MRRLLPVAAGLALAAAMAQKPPDAGQGRDVFQRRCGGCHDTDRNMEGPRLRGVYGRRSGSIAGFGYSEGLKKAGVTWDQESLDKWLQGPEAMVPDTDMAFRLSDAEERRAVIAYLKSLR
jgi:cytochrome c